MPTKVCLVKFMFFFSSQVQMWELDNKKGWAPKNWCFWTVVLERRQANYFTILYWFCHTLTWIGHGCTCVPHPETPSHLPPRTIPLGHPSAPALSTLYHALNLDWRFISHMIIYMFQWHSTRSSHPRPLQQSPKDRSIHLCLFCCLSYRVIVTIFLTEGPLDCSEMQPVSPKGNRFWTLIGRTDVVAETQIVCPPDTKNWLIGKDPDAGKDWRQEEKGTTENEIIEWHHRLNGHEFE